MIGKYKKLEQTHGVQSYELEGEPEVIHVIKTGFVDTFLIVKERGDDIEALGELATTNAVGLQMRWGIIWEE